MTLPIAVILRADWLRLCLVFNIFTFLSLQGQTANDAPIKAPSEVISLDPFTVSDTSRTGYQTNETTSATRFKVDVLDVPVSLSVIPQEVLRDVGTTDLRDALRYTASAENAGSGNFQSTSQNMSYRIRGFNTPFILKNGFRFSPEGGISVPATESVEIVKGPSSMLYGAIPPGGVVNVLTKRPQWQQHRELSVQTGSWDDYRVTLDSTGPVSEQLAYRVNAFYRDAGDFTDHTSRKAVEIVPSLEWRPFGEAGGKLFVEYTHLDQEENSVSHSPIRTRQRNADGVIVDGLAPLFYEQGFGIPTSWNIRPKNSGSHRVYDTLYADYSQRLSEHWHLRMAGLGNDQEIEVKNTSQALVVVLDSSPGPKFEANRPVAYNWTDSTESSWGVQTNLLGEFDLESGLKLNVLLGADYDYNDSTSRNRQSTLHNTVGFQLNNPASWDIVYPAESTFTKLTAHNAGENTAKGVYALVHAKMWEERFSVMLGMRHTDATAETINLTGTAGPSELSTDRPTYQAGVVFKVRPNVSLYGIYSESFQPQNQVLLDPWDPVTEINPSRAAQPLLGDGYDLGIKAALLEGRVQASAAYFSINNSNIVRTVSVRDAGNVTILDSYQVQSGEERVDGFELGVTGQLTPELSIMANYTHLNHEVASNPEDPFRVGQPLYGVFDDNVGLLVKYRFNDGGFDGLAVGAGYKYVSDGIAQPFLSNQIIVFPGYHTYDVFASYRFGREDVFLLRLNARNLTDEIYQVSEHMQGYPRSYQTSLTWSF
jgi:iron complex outermembrane receptor protein